MTYRLRKPEFIPTLTMLTVVCVTMYLALWQLQRLEEKKHLLAEIDAAQSQPPRDVTSLTQAELQSMEWHNITASGTLLNDKELYATPRYLNGRLGYAVLTPLAIDTPQGTKYLLINRGWVDKDHKAPGQRAEGNVTGKVNVEGMVRVKLTQGKFVPDNKPAENAWFWYDLPAMAKSTGLNLLPVLIDVSAIRASGGTDIKGGPQPFPVEINIRNDHKGYALTWFMIGLSAIGVYLAYYLEKKPNRPM